MCCCNEIIHDNLDCPVCPFCDLLIKLPTKHEPELCCKDPNVDIDGHSQLCFNCGQVNNEIFGTDYIDFHNDKYKITRKSVYKRKYHIRNVLGSIACKSGIYIHYYDIAKIQRIFRIVDNYEKTLNTSRKRMISIKFIIRKILEMLDEPHDHINVAYSKNTMKLYERMWNGLVEGYGDEILAIIH